MYRTNICWSDDYGLWLATELYPDEYRYQTEHYSPNDNPLDLVQ